MKLQKYQRRATGPDRAVSPPDIERIHPPEESAHGDRDEGIL